MRRLIINADDLGMTPGINRGIAECCDSGIVTATTLMASAMGFADAVAKFGRPPAQPRKLAIGCHVVLVGGSPLLPPTQVPSLVADSTGKFRSSLVNLARAATFGRIPPDQIEAEATAQMQKIQQVGICLSHFDTHKHAHLFPAILKPLLRAARACGIRALRNPFAPLKPLAFAHLLQRPHLWKRYTEVRVLRGWAGSFRRAVEDAGMVTTDGTFGILTTGALDLPLFRAIIGCIPEGTWEFCCHPGYSDPQLAQLPTRLQRSRDREREVLTSAAAREILEERGIQLISHWDLQ